MALRELVVVAECARQPLDEPFRAFARALQLPQLDEDELDSSGDADEDPEQLISQFLAVQPRAELLLRLWPDQLGAGNRWEKRESCAVFLQVAGCLLKALNARDVEIAEAFALRVVREKSAQLEKLLSWSDKPLIEFRALQLMGELAQTSGAVARELVRLFNFQSAAFVKLATRRWKNPEPVEDEDEDMEEKQAPFQLRQAYVELVLALTACLDKSVHRFATKEGGVTTSLFKSMSDDPPELLKMLFARLGELVLHNAEVERKSKLVVFNATCVHQLLALLQVEDDAVRETSLGVLNALLFDDSALYVVPQQQALRLFLSKSTAGAAQGDETAATSEQMYAVKVIRNAIVTIGVNELLHSSQAQTLVMALLAKYPGLLPEYLAALSIQLEPQPVFRWFCVASLVQKLLSCSLEAVPTGMPKTTTGDAHSSWWSAQSIAARLVAPGNFRKELSRGIQHGNNLVIYSSLGIMEALLQRYVRLAPSLKLAGLASDVQSELRFLVPSPEALVSLLLKLCASQEQTVALIYVRALTVFRLYLDCLPQTMREVKLDFTKTLAWRFLDMSTTDEALPAPMQNLIVAEMLRFLLAVDTRRLRFLFASSGSQSKLLQMLVLNVSTPNRTLQELSSQVLQRTLLASDVFGQESQYSWGDQHCISGRASEEISFWLESLRESGVKECASFMEHLMRTVMADPLLYVAIGSGVLTETSTASSLSPMTIALVAFLNSEAREATKSATADLSAYRKDSSVVAFSARILLSLLPTSKYPQQLVQLIASGDILAEEASKADSSMQQEEDESDGKKRKRPTDLDVAERGDDAYSWVKAYCEALVVEGHVSKDAVTRKKKAKATGTKYHRVGNPAALSAALTAMPPTAFTSSWAQIVSNCAEVTNSFTPVHHYLSSRGDIDVIKLLSSKPNKASPMEAFIASLPLHVIVQHVLSALTRLESKELKFTLATMKILIEQKLSNSTLTSAEAARTCEQLLFFFSSSSQLGFSDHGHEQLCKLLLSMLTLVIVSNESHGVSTPVAVVSRIFYKLRTLAGSVSSAVLCRQLSAVEVVALRLYSSNNPDTKLASLCDLSDLLRRAGVPLVAVLASRISSSECLPLLDRLLHRSAFGATATPHVVLIERVLASLGGINCSLHADKQYESFSDYKRSKLLTRKLWQLLLCQSSTQQVAFSTTGFTVLGQLGGIDAATALTAIETSLVPLVVRGATATGCTDVLRGIVTAIRSDDAAAFPITFEQQLLKHLQNVQDVRVRCALVECVYTVFTRITSAALRQFAQDLVPGCFERLLLPSHGNNEEDLSLLKHISSDASISVDMSALLSTAGTIMKRLAETEQNDVMSSTQILGFLLLLRIGGDDAVDVNLLTILVRTGLCALKQLKDSRADADLRSRLDAIAQMTEKSVRILKRTQDKQAVLKTLLPLFAEAREIVTGSSSVDAFETFVELSAALLRLVGGDASHVDYDFVAHLEAVVQHPSFAQTLQNAANSSLQLVLVQVIATLTRTTGNYTRTLLQSLLSAYSMSLSRFDRSLRVLFQEFEAQGQELSLAGMGFRFGASSASLSAAASHNDLVDDSAWLLGGGLEQARVRATIEQFPLEREVSSANDAALLDIHQEQLAEDDVETVDGDKEAEAYDPAFLLPMLSHFISSSDLPDAGIVQQGLLGVALRATSSRADSIRSYAYGILAHLHESLQATTEATSDFKAGRQVHLLLDVFRRAIEEPLEEVPSVLTVFLNDALGVLTRPTHVLYPQVNHFLLARPAMDLGDVPMFYSLFNSRAPLNFRQERSWLLHTLRRGVRRDEDVALLIRRHVLPMLLSFFTSELADTHTQPLIASILLETLRTPSGGVYLMTKAALLEWLATQFLRQGAAELSSRKEKQAPSALLVPLMTLFLQTLQDGVWDHLDAIQQHAASLQVANTFAALQGAMDRRVSSGSDPAICKFASVAHMVIRRSSSVCSLLVLQHALAAMQLHESKLSSLALDSAEVVARSIHVWLLQQQHAEAQKHRFTDWSAILRQVATILTSYKTHKHTLSHQQRAGLALDQLKAVLNELPTLKQLVLAQSATYAPALL